jgi:endonuclease/exonuclease/phosphatase family metal-dependent hydrolase
MRRLNLLILALVVGVGIPSAAEQIRITTWNLSWFPAGSPDEASPEAEAATIEAVARTLNSLQPDVVLLQEVRDKAACEQLARRLGPATYEVNVCSVFHDGRDPAPAKRQVAILSRYPVLEARAEEWQPDGVLHPPGGFAFAALRCTSADVGVFTLHLKNNIGSGDRATQFNILMREICAEQLVRRLFELAGRATNRLSTLIVGGNFNTDLDQPRFISERTLRALLEAGFSHGFDAVPLAERITCPGGGRYADATFDYLFVKGASFVAPPSVLLSDVSDHEPVTADLVLLPETATAAQVAPPPEEPLASLLPTLPPAPDTAGRNWTLYMFLGVLIALHLALWWTLQRRRATGAALAPTGLSPSAVPATLGETAPPTGRRSELEAGAVGERRGAAADASPGNAPRQSLVRLGLLPHLARLLANRLVQGLLSERSQLLTDQRAASAQIAEMERRLARLQDQLQQRLGAYEARIAELQREIEAKETENRQLRAARPVPEAPPVKPEPGEQPALPRKPVLRTNL